MWLKDWIKRRLAYRPVSENANLAKLVEDYRTPDAPYCPPSVGDLLYLIIKGNGYRRCLETGFYSG